MSIKIETCGVLEDCGAVFVIAEEANGERHIHERGNLTPAEAGRLSDRVEVAGAIDPDCWFYTYPRYGSPAFEIEEAAASEYFQSLRNGRMDESNVPFPLNTLL